MKRSKHSLSYYKLLSMNQGQLVPIGLTEVLPGDAFQHATSALIRVSPLVAPVMHPVRVRIHHFYCPTRLLWEDFEKFITGGPDGMDASAPPTISSGAGFATGSLADYLGVTPGVAGHAVSALPFRMYDLVWNEYYRDQDLETALVVSKASGVDATSNTTLQNCAWEKDYFTSARPWTQKGPEVTIPLGSAAPVVSTGQAPLFDSTGTGETALRLYSGPPGTQTFATNSAVATSSGDAAFFGSVTGLETDLSGATAADINELRLAFALQRYEEARARYGSRYTEYLRYLGIRASDARLQRPEYLGGGRDTIQWSEVLQTSPTTDGDDSEGIGNMKGHGIGHLRSNRYRRFFEEHGFVMTLMSVIPKTIYAQGLSRMWSRQTKEDYWQKELQFIGQQAVLNKEVKMDHATPEGTFGYQDRYDEYRRNESQVAGEFRDTLNYWHMARIFASDPALNATFVKANPTDRIYASTTTNQLYVMAKHSLQARRLVAKTGGSSVF